MEEVSSTCDSQILSSEKIDCEIEVLSRLSHSLREGFASGERKGNVSSNRSGLTIES